MVENQGTGSDGQSGGDRLQAQQIHHGSHNANGGHAGGRHGTHGGHHDGTHQERNQQAGHAGILDQQSQIVDAGEGFDNLGEAAAHGGDQQGDQSDLHAAGDPAVEDNLTERLWVFSGGIQVALANRGLVGQSQEHGVDHAHGQGHNLIAGDGH